MTYTEITDKIYEICQQIHNVNSYYSADVYDCWGRHDVKYSSVACYLLSAQREERLVTYNIILYYGDRLLNDNSNRDSIFDDGIRVLQTVLDNLPYHEIDYDVPITYTTFEQQFADNLAGVYANVSLTTTFDQGTCGLPLEAEI